jgi:hypothetical protein
VSADPFVTGVCVSLALNALALFASLALAVHYRPQGRAELVVFVAMLWNYLVMVPVYGLGLTGHLAARPLAYTSALFFAGVYLVARGPSGWRAFDREVLRGLWSLLRLPSDTLLTALRARGVVSIVVVFTLCMCGWTFLTAYYTPSWRQWDALWYHEPIVGFTIQNHGFAMVDLPQGGAQKINGYPRLAEMTQLWFVIFTDRRVIDMVNHLMTPALMGGVYLLARRSASRAVSLGLGASILCMPACAMLLGSDYVDVHNAAFVIAGAHFATRPVMRLRDAWVAAVCLGLGVASKHMAIVPALVFGLITAARAVGGVGARGRRLAGLATVLAGSTLIVATAAPTYARNWLYFKNPFWPDFKLDSDRFNIHWPGVIDWATGQFDTADGGIHLDMNEPFETLLEDLVRIPYSMHRGHQTQVYEYGIAIPSVVIPVTFFVVLLLALTPFRDLIARVLRRPQWRSSEATRSASLLAVGLLPMLYFSPALWGARYQIAAVGIALGLVGWAAGRGGEGRGHGLAGAIGVMSIVSFFWTEPRFWLWWSEAKKLAAIPYPEREVTQASTIDPSLDPKIGSAITKEMGLLREKQLGPGAVLAFPSNYGIYMGLFWNNDFSNKIVWVREGPDFMDRLAASNATWAFFAYPDPLYSSMKDKGSGWAELGPLNTEHWGAIFRRTRW